MSVETGFPRQRPAASGPAVSFDSAGKSSRRPPLLKLKSSFLGQPSKSHRASASEGEAFPSPGVCPEKPCIARFLNSFIGLASKQGGS